MTDPEIYEPFENCTGLEKKWIKESGSGWHDPFQDDRYTLAYYVKGFKNVFVVYDWEEDKVLWFQNINGNYSKKRGVRVWEAMTSGQQKAFLFDIDWFVGD
jgi:hypothetical protein